MIKRRGIGVGVSLVALAGAACDAGGDAAGRVGASAQRVTSTTRSRRPDFNGDGRSDLVIGVPDEDTPRPGQPAIANAGMVHVIYGASNGLAAATDRRLRQEQVPPSWQDLPGVSETDDHFGAAVAWGDFDRDGFSDLVVGIPGKDNARGAVLVVYGSSSGLDPARAERWSFAMSYPSAWERAGLSSSGGSGLHPGDRYGAALAVGDFNNDSIDDLAVGAPGCTVTSDSGTFVGSGAVHVIFGYPGWGLGVGDWSRLRLGNDQVLTDRTIASHLPRDADNAFGTALAAGDFDGDGWDDLAIGQPGFRAGGGLPGSVVGNVRVANGVGLSGAFWTVGFAGTTNAPIGFALAAGDFDGNGRADLAVGIPGRTVAGHPDAGAVEVHYGRVAGLSNDDVQVWTQGSSGVAGSPDGNDRFGASLVAGDFDDNDSDDLAIGAPGETIGSATAAGAVNVLFGGSGGGLSSAGNQVLFQGQSDVLGVSEAHDHFGQSLSMGDFDGNGFADLAVSVPNEACPGGATRGGLVQVFYARGPSGSSGTPTNEIWREGSGGLGGTCEANDHFGGQQ
jgi:hypothetical protein